MPLRRRWREALPRVTEAVGKRQHLSAPLRDTVPSLQLHGGLKVTTTGRYPALKGLRTLVLVQAQWEQRGLVAARAPRPL